MRQIPVLSVLAALYYCLCLISCTTVPDGLEPLKIPSRSSAAPSATQLRSKLSGANEAQREDIIFKELVSGNLPNFLRRQIPIKFSAKTRSGQSKVIQIWTLPDYLAVGHDHDFVRVPMSSVTAQRLADRFGLMLPTAKIVDLLYQSADLKLRPQPLKPGPSMVSTAEFYKHQEMIQKQLGGKAPRKLVAGHKKDIVLTNKIAGRPDKLAIYGWHQAGGQPIQPLSAVHGYWYADYSHGIRLVTPLALVGDKMYRISDILRDPELAPLLSYEGPLTMLRYPTENLSLDRSWWPRS